MAKFSSCCCYFSKKRRLFVKLLFLSTTHFSTSDILLSMITQQTKSYKTRSYMGSFFLKFSLKKIVTTLPKGNRKLFQYHNSFHQFLLFFQQKITIYFFFFRKKNRNEHKWDSNKDIFYNKHKFEAMYMYLRQVTDSGRGHRTQEPFSNPRTQELFNALPLSSYP